MGVRNLLLAFLPYQWAYLLWVLISCGLYLAGLQLLRVTFYPLRGQEWLTVLLLAFSFAP